MKPSGFHYTSKIHRFSVDEELLGQSECSSAFLSADLFIYREKMYEKQNVSVGGGLRVFNVCR